MVADAEVRPLEATSTWAIAAVCFVIILISIILEQALHLLTKFFVEKRRKSLYKALYKIKSELMLFGFLSLLLTVTKKPISKICIPKKMGETFLPCKTTSSSNIVEKSTCGERGKLSLVSEDGLDQLQILIFILAIFHVLSCVLSFGLGTAKVRCWKLWEDETRSFDYQFSNEGGELLSKRIDSSSFEV